MQPVELRFSNSTGMPIDSVFFNIGEDMQNYKVENMSIGEITEYEKFDYGYFNVQTTAHIDGLVLTHSRIDLLCCLSEGRYTVDFEIVLDSNNEEKTSTNVTMDE